MKRPVYYIVSAFVLLALLGLGSQLFEDPIGTLKTFLIFAAVTGIIIFVVLKFTGSSNQSANQKAYNRAAKQSKKNHQQRSAKTKDSNVVSYSFNHSRKKVKHRKKSNVQLTVIDGKKGKKKNRA
ncbi:MAG: SA1362 family protein [Bacillus sp. (in: firmicutes)]